MSTETIPRTRKKNARPKEIVFGALDERISMIADNPHAERIRELLDELRRATNGKAEDNAD